MAPQFSQLSPYCSGAPQRGQVQLAGGAVRKAAPGPQRPAGLLQILPRQAALQEVVLHQVAVEAADGKGLPGFDLHPPLPQHDLQPAAQQEPGGVAVELLEVLQAQALGIGLRRREPR